MAARGATRLAKAQAIAILLDTKKAYDSLNRRFLSRSIKHRGFGAKFCRAIKSMHANTTARFQVNGSLPRAVRTLRGIRQGCPLAPLLFVLALDALYRRILKDPEFRQPVATDTGVLPVAGYANDTALVLADERRIPYAIDILDEFTAVSELSINRSKSMVVRLCASAGSVTQAYGLKVLDNAAWCRYLGIQVGTTDAADHAWHLCIEQIKTRLRLAHIKTNTVAQRAALAKAIIVPKILFVARHCWPESPQVDVLDSLMRNFVWCGLFTRSYKEKTINTRGRTWMQQPLAKMPLAEGGLGVPCVRTELMIMATTVVGQWAYSATPQRRRTVQAAGWKAADAFIQPLQRPSTGEAPRYRSTLWETGERALEVVHGQECSLEERLMTGDGAKVLETRGHNPWEWDWRVGGLERNYSHFYQHYGREIQQLREELRGRCNTDWLEHVDLSARLSPLIDSDGSVLTSKQLRQLGQGSKISDFVRWTWTGPFTLRFEPVQAQWPFNNNRAAELFVKLSNVIVANYPEILRRLRDCGSLYCYNVSDTSGHEWSLTDHSGSQLMHSIHGACADTTAVGTTRDLTTLRPIQLDGIWMKPHLEHMPLHSRLVAQWSEKHGGKRVEDDMQEHQGPTSSRTGRRPGRSERISGTTPNGSSRRRWRSSIGNGSERLQACMPERVNSGTSSACIKRAEALWAKVAQWWECYDGPLERLALPIFSWQPPPSKIQWREITDASTLPQATVEDRRDRLRHWRQIAWRQLCFCVIAHLWYKRVAETHEPTEDPEAASWPAVLARWCQELHSTTAHLIAAKTDSRDLDLAIHRALCLRLLAEDAQEVSVPISREARYLLFFDGGSRGNPGPGGSGAVIARILPGEHTTTLIWVAAMSYASVTTTNNLAEYRGLRTGLQAAADHKWHPLHVIGDSQLILTQMRRRLRPKTASLRTEYSTAQHLCDGLVIAGWHHHYRTYNKMADKAANVAMDEGASTQVFATTSRPLIHAVQVLMQPDVYHWASAQWEVT